eukprot:TRINITY_DN32244_c0_g1_i1.p1 TRINITY_DN32244_c0_g1~~TRINITY_DN32244_c0_g1_i1.p1  ORF type:complete len:137 (+),score=21.60 TRINITY_DN32244_c0_g1_i1:231-641(+)
MNNFRAGIHSRISREDFFGEDDFFSSDNSDEMEFEIVSLGGFPGHSHFDFGPSIIIEPRSGISNFRFNDFFGSNPFFQENFFEDLPNFHDQFISNFFSNFRENQLLDLIQSISESESQPSNPVAESAQRALPCTLR